ncbi:MAG: hypothetical protein DMG09_31060, partial [Acidobacteria bacterium]
RSQPLFLMGAASPRVLLAGPHDDRGQRQVRVAPPVLDRAHEAQLQAGRQISELGRLFSGG